MIIWILSLIILIICLIFIFLGFKWIKITELFNEKTYTYFELVFLSLYFLEQFVFIVISFCYPEYSKLFVGLFALIVLTTISGNKLMMECKNKKLESINKEIIFENKEIKNDYEGIIEDLEGEIHRIEKKNKMLREYLMDSLEE